jgi:spore germination protein
MQNQRRVLGLMSAVMGLSLIGGCGFSAHAKKTSHGATKSKHATSHKVASNKHVRQAAANSAVPVKAGRLQVLAYYATGVHVSLTSLWKYPKSISVFSPFWYSVNATGAIKSTVVPSVLSQVRKYHIPVEPLVNDSTGVQAFLKTQTTRVNAARNIADMVKAGGYQGVDIDFEPPNSALASELTNFMMDLRDRLPRQDVITMAIVPNSGGGYDFKALNPEVTQYVLMSYDEHSQGTPAGPVAAAPWVENILARTEQSVPASKIILGIPLYGYAWPVGSTNAATIPYSAVTAQMNANAVWNAQDMESTAKYTVNGTQYVAWWESLEGMKDKIALAKKDKLAGVALWRLGYQNNSVMQLLMKQIGAQRS